MAITKDDLRDFNRFVDEKLDNGGVDSLVKLAREWEAMRHESTEIASELDEHTARTVATAFPDDQDDERLRQAIERRGGITTAQLLNRAVNAAI
jgi:hypothetical protein